MTQQQENRRTGVVGVHSVNRFVFSVPDLDEATRFYAAFGLDVRRVDDRVDLYCFDHPHCWASIYGGVDRKRLEYVSYGVFEDDLSVLSERVERLGLSCASHPFSDGSGIWLKNPDGTSVQLVVGPKVSPSAKTVTTAQRAVPPAGQGAAPARSQVPQIRPRTLSHILFYSPNVTGMLRFSEDVLGLRLSDHSGGGVAFLHGAHGSDHHLVAYAMSNAPGLHHSSWDVGSLDDVGLGAEQMRTAGFNRGWGLGRHVLGSNYFHYVRDPWGSYAEYSFDIDFVPHDLDWPAADHPPHDSFYVWGPAVPEDFGTNFEVQPA